MHATRRVRHLAGLAASMLVTGMLATAGLVATSAQPAAAAGATCTYNGMMATSDLGIVTPGTTTVAISCTGLTPSATFAIADASPLADVTTGGVASKLNLAMGGIAGLHIVSSDASGSLTTTFTVPAATTAPNADGTCPPSKAQVDAGLVNCAVAVANAATGVDEGSFALLNYPGQPTPDPSTLTLSPTGGLPGTTVTVSGSNWWGDGTGLNPSIPASDITLGGVPASTSSVTVPVPVYTPGAGTNGAGGTLTGGAITGTFSIPSAAPVGPDSLKITEPNLVPANDSPYSGATISATSTFTFTPPPSKGYWLVGSDGGVFSFGNAPFLGSTGGIHLNAPVVGTDRSADGQGYWLGAADGGVFAFGDSKFFGSMGGKHLNAPVVAVEGTTDSHGYWLGASDGGIFAFGDAPFLGSTGGRHLNAPVVGMAATPDGHGYWLVGADGGVFAFGDAQFFGSQGGMHLAAPVVGMAANPDGKGYWLVAANGQVFAFGDAHLFGSTGGGQLNAPVVAMDASSDGQGYWMVAANGGVSAFGDAPFLGSTGRIHLNAPMVGMAGTS